MPAQHAHPRDLARRLLDLTQQQVAAAGADDWATVSDLLDHRAPLAAAVAALDLATLDAAARNQLRAALRAALDLDQEVTRRGLAALTTVRHDLTNVRRGRQALRLYGGRPSRPDALPRIDQPG
jgi:hypothetical protein